MSHKEPSNLDFQRMNLVKFNNDFDDDGETIFETTPITKPIKETVSFSIDNQQFWTQSEWYAVKYSTFIKRLELSMHWLWNWAIKFRVRGKT